MSVSRGEGRSRHGGVGAARKRQIASWWSCYHLAVAVWSWYWVEAREGLLNLIHATGFGEILQAQRIISGYLIINKFNSFFASMAAFQCQPQHSFKRCNHLANALAEHDYSLAAKLLVKFVTDADMAAELAESVIPLVQTNTLHACSVWVN
ncbi:hypothetical protein WN943_005931 [Citrus x changshan-huyou]